MSEPVELLGVGDTVKLPEGRYIVSEIEQGSVVRKADVASDVYERQLRRRFLNRYMELEMEEHKRNDIIREEWLCIRVKSNTQQWNVFQTYKVTKEQHD